MVFITLEKIAISGYQPLWNRVFVPLCWVLRVGIYRCFLLPSSRWHHLLNGGIISESITSLLDVKWRDTLSMVWKFIIDFVTFRHWWRGDGLVLARWFIQSWANPEVILVHYSSSIDGRIYIGGYQIVYCLPKNNTQWINNYTFSAILKNKI